MFAQQPANEAASGHTQWFQKPSRLRNRQLLTREVIAAIAATEGFRVFTGFCHV